MDEFEGYVDAMRVLVRAETKNKIMVKLNEAYGPMTFQYVYFLGKPGKRPWGGRVSKNGGEIQTLGRSELRWIFSIIERTWKDAKRKGECPYVLENR